VTDRDFFANQVPDIMLGTESKLEKPGPEKVDAASPPELSGDLHSAVQVAERKIQENVRAKVLDNAYAAKSQLVGEALSLIGLTRWQYLMWSVCGFSWIVDNIANYAMAVTFTSVAREWTIPDITMTNIAFSLGGLIGSLFWSVVPSTLCCEAKWRIAREYLC
jgi:hypothetical protein